MSFFSPAPQLLCTLALLFFCLPAFSQQTWWRTYGGTGDDEGQSVQQTSDGGYIIAGTTNSFGTGGYNVYLVKTDSLGDTLWTKTYGPIWGYCVQQTSDGGYILIGESGHFYLIKTDSLGDTLWTKTYGGYNGEMAYSGQQTSDRGYILAGWTNSFGAGNADVYLVKTDSLGDTLWTRTYGGAGDDGAYSVRQTSDSGYILTGWTDSFGAGLTDVYVIKTNASGDTLWTRTFGGTSWDEGHSVQQTTDGGYIICGATYSFANFEQVYLIKTNKDGVSLWTRTYGGANQDQGYSVRQTLDGGYIVAGRTNSFGGGDFDVSLIKTDANGDTLWTKAYGSTGHDEGYSVQQTTDTGYIIAGMTTSFGAGSYDVYLIKTDANGNVGVTEQVGSKQKAVSGIKANPNPFVSYASVPGHSSERFALYDISGRKVGTYKGDRIGEGLSAGVYFLKPEARDAKPLRVVKLR